MSRVVRSGLNKIGPAERLPYRRTCLRASRRALALKHTAATAHAAQSCDATWSGDATGTWSDAANWLARTLPTATDSVCLPDAATITVDSTVHVASVHGGTIKLTGGVTVAEGKSTLEVDSDGRSIKGKASWTDQSGSLTVAPTGLAVSGNTAWITGTSGSHKVVVYVLDAGEPGTGDVFRIWIDGVERTSSGHRTAGNLQVDK